MALHSEGRHGWGSASLPETTWGDAVHCVAIAEKLAAEIERLGVIGAGWTVPAERASYAPHSAGAGCIVEPDGSSTNFTAQGSAVIVTADGDVSVHVGDEYVWVAFPPTVEREWRWGPAPEQVNIVRLPARHSLRVPRATVGDAP